MITLRVGLTGLILLGVVISLAACSREQTTAAPTSLSATASPAPEATATAMDTPSPEPSSTPQTEEEESAANADVTFVRAEQAEDGAWRFQVTVEHPDTGWEDYADGWDVVTPEGTVLKPDPESPFTRLLLHPHVDEQPFTRSQSGITIPPELQQVTVRAHDLVDGFGGQEVVVDLSRESGPNFEVVRP